MPSKRITFSRLLVVLLLGWQANGVTAEDQWSLSKELQGIQLYSRFPPGAQYKEYRGEIEVNAKPDRIVRLFQDLSKISEWHYRTEKVEVLNLIDMTNAYVHIINNPPWPIKKRDVVCRVSLKVDETNDEIRITLSSIDNQLPATEEYVRTAKLEAEWLIKPVSENKSSLRYQVYIEPGGKIPRWLFNSVAMDVPLFTLIKLRSRFNSKQD
ncbi:MAG: START domain-containing protein [Gammaproteobacteria bacterium]